MNPPDPGFVFMRENQNQDWMDLETASQKKRKVGASRASHASGQFPTVEGPQVPSPPQGQIGVDTEKAPGLGFVEKRRGIGLCKGRIQVPFVPAALGGAPYG